MKFIFIFVYITLVAFWSILLIGIIKPNEYLSVYVFGTLILMVLNMGLRRIALDMSFFSHYSLLSPKYYREFIRLFTD